MKLVLSNIQNTENLSSLNDNFDKIEQELQNKVLYRNNPTGEPNTMETSLDMDGQRILNLPAPRSDNEPVRLIDMIEGAISIDGMEASDIAISPITGIAGDTVQEALGEIVQDIADTNTNVTNLQNEFDTYVNSQTTGATLFLRSSIEPTYAPVQKATDPSKIVLYGGAIYALWKGSYNLNDYSFITVARPSEIDGTIKEIQRVDIGLGADARAMCIHEGHVYVFATENADDVIKVYRITNLGLELKATHTRYNSGMVQSCRVINDFLVACNWGAGNVQVFDLINGIPSHERSFAVGDTGNANIYSWGNIHYMTIHQNTNNLVRLDISSDGTITQRGRYSFANLVRPRYGYLENGVLVVGSFDSVSGKTLAIDVSGTTPVLIDTYMNIGSPVRIGKYIYGAGSDQTPPYLSFYGELCRIDMDTGAVTTIDPTGMLYPVRYNNTIVGFKIGFDPNPPGSHQDDLLMGYEISVYTPTQEEYPEFPAEEVEPHFSTKGSLTLDLEIPAIGPGEAFGKWVSFSPAKETYGFMDLKYYLLNNKTTTRTYSHCQARYGFYVGADGVPRIDQPRYEAYRAGTVTTALDLAISGENLIITLSGSTMDDAIIYADISWVLTDAEAGTFISPIG